MCDKIYYDTETGLYYLQTRYYDPELGRFISQDSIEYADPETINGLNLYAYCDNNPVMNVDPTGELFLSIFLGALIAGVLIGGVKTGSYGKEIALL
ncbi:MAG: RHS repeat-associated core domain-containing protein [Clostridia bacterium]|nr:RHS repeat-associated core domain-containing protein [Clostridia bacterium]